MAVRHLEKLRVIVREATRLDITYAYDDLVFPEHAAFLLQFDDGNPNNYICYFHRDCVPKETEKIFGKLLDTCIRHGCTIANKGRFDLEQKGEEVEIRFLKEA